MIRLRGIAWAGLAIGLLLAVPGAAQAATFDVTTTEDHAVGACDASDCTLREAVVAANSNPNPGEIDEIRLRPGSYVLSDLAGAGDSAAVSDLDVTQPLKITGAGASSTTIDATPLTGQPVIQADPNASTIELVDVTITGGDAAGIQNAPAVSLTLTRSAVVGNSGSATGGGIDAGTGSGLTLTDTTVSGNTASDGAGIYVNGPGVTVTNSTISGNQASSEGGGVYVEMGTLDFVNSTVAFNTAPTGAGIANNDETTLKNTIVSDNTGGGNNCGGLVPVVSQGSNIEDTDTCSLNASGDKPNTDPVLGALTNNGGTTQTHALGGTSPAVNAAGGCPPPSADQRGTPRPQGAACDMGAYELVTSRTVPTVPDCSPTGTIPLEMVPGETPVAFHYKLDGGPTQDVPTSDETATINLPEGRFGIEYWSETAESGPEPQSQHQVGTALVDKTAPDLSVSNDQELSIFVITRTATVTVAASDPGAEPSGLTSDPTAATEAVTTDSRGDRTVEWTAVDLCENETTKTFDYTVLGPGLGERAVVEPLGEDVEVKLAGGAGARASQKGNDFEPVAVPREIPVGSIIDARDGKARITSSKSTTETDVQDGRFVAGVFKVLQSRKESKNGLTTLRLRKGNFNRCKQKGKRASAALSRRAIRRLRARARGRFRTRSRYSAATVRGTKWTVTDRCDGTLTTVKRGRVVVRDFRRESKITLTAGKRYLARAR